MGLKLADCCPKCPVRAPAVAPYRTEPDPAGATAFYRCPSGHHWWTAWLLSETEMEEYAL